MAGAAGNTTSSAPKAAVACVKEEEEKTGLASPLGGVVDRDPPERLQAIPEVF